ncbi:HicB family protein [Paraburkholderia sp. RP-4-7]|uniref:HicB family protein n=1 Tax=Paraburkholderia polaris TaxID=2728848 RepID=A0A848IMJ7_9BURK|nr:type II toxin-antitoxin system HicB family antitoxin [Paraburkholderia polaris]NMM02991.1 HicB family protein [Paraburkholderia polaris]
MQYPLYVHRNDDLRYRGSFPDFPGAHACGNSLEELKHNALDVVQRVYDGSEDLIPAPTSDTSALQALDMDDGEGLWLFVEIDMARVISRAVRIQLSLSKSALQDVDAAAQQCHMTRSAFITLACIHELENAEVAGAPPEFATMLADST